MVTVVYALIFASSSTQYLSRSGFESSFADALGSARTPLTFLGYGITGLAQLGSTALIAYKAWYAPHVLIDYHSQS